MDFKSNMLKRKYVHASFSRDMSERFHYKSNLDNPGPGSYVAPNDNSYFSQNRNNSKTYGPKAEFTMTFSIQK